MTKSDFIQATLPDPICGDAKRLVVPTVLPMQLVEVKDAHHAAIRLVEFDPTQRLLRHPLEI